MRVSGERRNGYGGDHRLPAIVAAAHRAAEQSAKSQPRCARDLDADADLFVQVEQAALSLASMVAQLRSGAYRTPDQGLHSPREK